MHTEIQHIFSTNSLLKQCVGRLKTQPLKSIYTTFIPKKLRKKIDIVADLSQQNHTAKNWKTLLDYQQKNNLSFQVKPKKHLDNAKIIWQYWGQGWEFEKLPEIVQLCYRSVESYKGDYQVIRLDDKRIHEYLDIPEFISEKRLNPEFKYVFFSDLLRLMLLNAYGGVWLDATILLTDEIPKEIKEQDFFVFHREANDNQQIWKKLNADYFSWHNNHRVNMLSSIMVAKKGNIVVNKLLNAMLLFWQTQEKIRHYFFFQILFDQLFNQVSAHKQFASLDDTLPHLLQRILTQPFNRKSYEEIMAKSALHKMTYVKNEQSGTYYAFLKERFNL